MLLAFLRTLTALFSYVVREKPARITPIADIFEKPEQIDRVEVEKYLA